MLRDVVMDKCYISVLVSADSDLVPPIQFIKEYKPNHKVFVYFPPGRFSYDLQNKATNIIQLERHESKFRNAIFPESINLGKENYLIQPKNGNENASLLNTKLLLKYVKIF